MTHPIPRRRAGIAVVLGLAFAAVPGSAQAGVVSLGTASPFVVLGGSTVTNTGPSVLNGDLGVSPGTSLVGFGTPAAVNGATHANDAVANGAQSDLTTAYDVAAGQPVSPGNVLTGTDLGSRTLTPGAYRYATSAQLTGALTLDAQGDPNAEFIFEIGSTLTTASASSVVLINGASACNVYWQIGSSATIGSTTAFQGTVMALTDISLDSRATVVGRMLARNGQVTLIDNTLSAPNCSTPGTTPGATPGATPVAPVAKAPPASRSALKGTAVLRRTPGSPLGACEDGFSATVTGSQIKRVVFRLDGRRISSRSGSPFRVLVRGLPGKHTVTAFVTFKDATRAKTLSLDYRACSQALLQPRRGPSRFTG